MAALGLIRHIREIGASTHPGKLDLLPLVQRLVELRQRGADGGRPIHSMIESAGFQIDRVETGYMPGPKPMAFIYEGSARPG